MCNEYEINMSEWNLDRIQAEQDKHMSFKVTGVIPKVDTKQVSCNLTELDNALDAYMRKVSEDTDMYIICEIAKLYIESQRPAEWEYVGMGISECTNCKAEYEAGITEHCNVNNSEFRFCPNCGRRMKNGC